MKRIIFGEKKNIIGSKLAELRKRKSLSQQELAAKMQILNVNIDQQMISKIEMNKRQVTDYELACFCFCLNIDPNEMLSSFYDEMREA